MAQAQRITLSRFISQRLGDEQDVPALLARMLVLSFGAASFREFWRFWNPVYGYLLYFYCYKPLRRRLPRVACVAATFFLSGFVLHDLLFGWWIRAIRTQGLPFPFVGAWFLLMGMLVVVTDGLRLNWDNAPLRLRVLLNSACIFLAFLLTLCVQGILRARWRWFQSASRVATRS